MITTWGGPLVSPGIARSSKTARYAVSDAAGIPAVRRAALSALLNGNAALSPEMALRVEKAFGVSMDMRLRMQAWYDASRMRARASEPG